MKERVPLPEFPRHWLAVAGDDPTRPLPHDHAMCDQIEGAIACLFTGGWRFTPDNGPRRADGVVVEEI